MKKDHTYQQDLLRKFIDGTITIDERHELEKLALDDDLLFDTLEGYSATSVNDHKTILNEINTSLQNLKKPERRIIPWQWMSAAAGLILVAAIGFLIKIEDTRNTRIDKSISMESKQGDEGKMANLKTHDTSSTNDFRQSSDTKERIEMEEVMEEMLVKEMVYEKSDGPRKKISKESNREAEAIPSPSIQKKNQNESVVTAEEIQALPTKNISEIAATSAGLSTSDGDDEVSIRGSRGNTSNYYVDGIRVSQSSIPAEEQDATPEIVELEDAPLNKSELDASSSNYQKKSKREQASEMLIQKSQVRILKGQVLDANGNGLIGANILEKKTKEGVMSDIDGNFELKIPDNNTEITVSYLGFENLSQSITADQDIVVIQMVESTALLDEVIVSSYKHPLLNQNAMPFSGHESFEEYLSANLIMPDDCDRKQVDLSFTINSDGEIKNIDSDIKDSCFNEARRLIMDGGKWKTVPPRKEMRIEYRVYMRR